MRFYKQTTLRATAFGRPALLPFTLLSILLPPPDRLAFVVPLPEFKTRMLLSKTTSWHSRNGSEMSPKWTQISTTLAEQNTMSTQKQWVCCVQSQRLLEPGSGCLPASRPRNLAAKLCQITLLIYMEDGIYLYAYIHTYIYIYISNFKVFLLLKQHGLAQLVCWITGALIFLILSHDIMCKNQCDARSEPCLSLFAGRQYRRRCEKVFMSSCSTSTVDTNWTCHREVSNATIHTCWNLLKVP